ncbi:uncharacterized protein BO66DRAFT_319050 [Aspergillus aculeatinus CBS 121060]|uniref:Uncharacterized protein n=1 Tax=Aspergillus aculeatinus CBS 121060 TaxID=1448322 RepID=A0ACD1HEL4_9EURO|nr:hypothetical protein BO66DRAFT_319050 [Aspergillus aculeatinus CBS 121060]RAH71831.1 hypothetical protein BO66DRAFT_319050 [Aspergillus aculeatinus CBS 121060]
MSAHTNNTRGKAIRLLTTWWDRFRYTIIPSSDSKPEHSRPRRESWLPRGFSKAPKEGSEWIKGALICTWITATILTLNISMLVVALVMAYRKSTNRARFQMAELYNGQCSVSSHWSTGIHVAINALSTVLLGASNYVMQCLSAPSRDDIDQAHASSRWLDIGSFSFRNMTVMSPRRKLLWGLLLVSSLPIHMIYNSVFFTSIATLTPGQIMVPHNLSPNESLIDDSDPTSRQYFRESTGYNPAALQARIFNGTFTNVTTDDCLAKYRPEYNTKYGTLIFVADRQHFYNTSSLMTTLYLGASPHSIVLPSHSEPSDNNLTVTAMHWSYRVLPPLEDIGMHVPVLHCLIDESQQHCQLFVSPPIAIAVIICNIVKLTCMALAARVKRKNPLLTTGDALASFLSHPDPTTRGRCLLSRAQMTRGVQPWSQSASSVGHSEGIKMASVARSDEHGVQAPLDHLSSPTRSQATTQLYPSLVPSRKRWYQAVSRTRRLTVLFFYISSITAGAYLVYYGIQFSDLKSFGIAMDLGFSQISSATIIDGISNNQIALVLLANTPQFVFSCLYFMVNGVLTSMIVDAELHSYTAKRRPLRCSWPKGQQRSTYYLTLPYRYSLPLLAASATLHWLLSESIFFVYIREFDIYQTFTGTETQGCCYSPMATLVTVVVGAAGLAALVGLGFRRYDESHMPLVGGCSAALSALCHPPDGDEGAARKAVMWGEIPRDPYTHTDQELICTGNHPNSSTAAAARTGTMETEEYAHCSFTSWDVVTPNVVRLYA